MAPFLLRSANYLVPRCGKGLITFTFEGQPNSCLETRVDLTQTDRAVRGQWTVTGPPGNDIKGEITGTLEGVGEATTFTGTVEWNSEIGTGTGRCFGRATFAGLSAPPQLRWNADRWQMDNCTDRGIRDIVWTMTPTAPPACVPR